MSVADRSSPMPIAGARIAPTAGKIVVARLRDLALLPALALLVVIGTIVSPVFPTSGNINTILTSSAALALVVLAESLVIITGKFDLSLESVYGFAPAIGAMVVVPAAKFGFGFELPTFVCILVVLLVGGLIGFINGFMVVRLRLSAFFVAGIVLRYHRLGRALYAIGGNPEAARAAGIRVERITWGVYVLAGILAAVGGLEITGYVGAISANQGNGLIFTVFAAAVIGGISLDGGKGTMFGALTGVLLLGVVGNLLTLAQVPSFWIQAIYGAIILGSLMVARFASGQSQE